MIKNKFFSFFISCSFALPLLLTGCKNNNDSIATKPVDYEATFIESDKTVSETKIKVYEGPKTFTSSDKCKVSVEGQELFVYETLVNYNRQFTWSTEDTKAPVVLFDFEGKVHMEVEINTDETITTASLSPLAYQIPIAIDGNKLSFDLEYQSNYVLTFNDDYKTAIHIFTNEIEEDEITEEMAKNDDSIVYIGPGLYKADTIPVKDNSTIYIAGGAFVYGDIHGEVVENLTIKGHGIISGDIYTRTSDTDYTVPVVLRNAKHIVLEDITFLNPAGWVINLYKCEDVKINNIKIISARQNGDGISVQSSKDVTVKGGFVRTWDDSLVVKNNDLGTTENVTFDGVTVWTDLAQSMEVGYETHGAYMKNITFKNITVLNNFHKAVISMHNCDEAEISNVTYENITVENAAMFGDDQTDGENDFFIDFTIAYNVEWTESGGDRGSIDGVNIHNVKVYNEEELEGGVSSISSRMLGESDTSMIKNVTIKGIEIEGRNISNAQDLKLTTNNYVSNVNFEAEEVHGAEIYLPYKLDLKNTEAKIDVVESPTQDGILTPSFSWKESDRSFLGSKASTEGFTFANTHGKGTTNKSEADDGSGDFALTGHSANNVYDNDLTTYYQNAEWKNENDEFAAITVNFNRAITVGTLRIIGLDDNKYYSTYTISVWVLKDPAKSYVRSVGLRTYEMSPIVNNCIDINITAQEYYGIQLRLFKVNGPTNAINYQISEVEFYQPSLTFNKAIVDSTEHNDVYTINRVNDGDPTGTSYYESKTLPAYFVIDLGDIYDLKTFGLFLSPSLAWSARTQEIEILVSPYNSSYDKNKAEFVTASQKTAYLFDPSTGNNNIVSLENKIQGRFIKVIIYSNTDKGGYGGQLAEFTAYSE
ncbi:MAG: glycosyl hydrolase family 28 protein [bacterium]|nr:glycosyl hydrolase family 28 protein [bacterium]